MYYEYIDAYMHTYIHMHVHMYHELKALRFRAEGFATVRVHPYTYIHTYIHAVKGLGFCEEVRKK
jgi:hypothetical protein